MPFQVLNPMEAMQVGADRARANRLADIQEADVIRAQREREMLNQLYQQAYNKQTGNVDFNELYGGLAAQGMGTAIPGIQKSQADIAKTRADALKASADAQKTQGEMIQNRVKYWRDLIPTDPLIAPNWVAGIYSDPAVAPILNQIGTADQVIKTIPKDPVAYQQWAQNWSMGAQKFNEAMMPYVTPKSPAVMEQELKKATAGKTSVNVTTQAESEFGKGVASEAAKDLNAQFKQTEAAVRGIKQTDRVIDLLKKGQPITGIAADLELGVRRLRDVVAKRQDKSISDTELLEAILGQDVFTQIQQLGIGARGLDTPAEREFLRQTVSGTKTLNKDTLLRMAEIKRQAQEDIVNAWNQRTQSGELDDWYKYSKRPKKTFEVPARQDNSGQGAPASQGQKPAPSAPANSPVVVTSKAELDSLPSGSLYIGPDNITRRKK